MTRPAEEYRAALESRLGSRGFAHSMAVAESAGRLADVYGVDRDLAFLGGLLHDWARDEGAEALLAEAASCGIEVTPVDEAVPYLLHARVGAAQLARAFPELPAELVTAVERHTTGAAGMSELDMVVYLGDMLEPSRVSADAEMLRAAVGEVPLGELYARAYAASVGMLLAGRRRIHPATVEAWNAIVAGEGGR